MRLTIDDYEWDPAKRLANLRKHRLDFRALPDFEWAAALIDFDDGDADEDRMKAYGFIGENLHVLIYAERGAKVRAISLRRAEKQEWEYYYG